MPRQTTSGEPDKAEAVRSYKFDAFISHANEDKDGFVAPLAYSLVALGAKIWYDDFSLKLGDSLLAKIDEGLSDSRFGIVVLSKQFFAKQWPQQELRGLFARETVGTRVIIPIWYGVTYEDVLAFSSILADKKALNTTIASGEQITLQILAEIRPDISGERPHELLRKIASGEGLDASRMPLDLSAAGDPLLEQAITKNVGSYGRQLGRIGDALEVILKHVKLGELTPEEQDTLLILKAQLAVVRQVKFLRSPARP